MEVLSDDVTNELASAVQRISGISFDERTRSGKDIGEVMVVAHAAVAAEAGGDVIVLIDDGAGCHSATQEAQRIQRMHDAGKPVGSIRLVHTVTVLEGAAGTPHIPDKNAVRQLYGRLKALDDGLLPLGTTSLLRLPCWAQDDPAQGRD